MPDPTVTVSAPGSNSNTWSKCRRERKLSVLSAIRLKQWRVPSTFSLWYFFTNSLTCSMDWGEYNLPVLYSILPAQFLNFSSCSQLVIGEITAPATKVEDNLRNVLL